MAGLPSMAGRAKLGTEGLAVLGLALLPEALRRRRCLTGEALAKDRSLAQVGTFEPRKEAAG